MICGMTYYQICWYFLIYSFGGWIVEVIFHAVALGKVINRGFLNGPVCPVYGFGVLSVFALINTLQSGGRQMSDVMLFVFGVILATAVELIAGWLLDVCFHARWWDYSDKPLNFHGYICMEFSLLWGMAIVLVVKVFQKYVENSNVMQNSSTIGWVVLAILYALYFVDFVVTVAVIQGLNKKLTKLDKIRSDMRIVSDKISTTVATTTIDTAQKVGEGKVQAALAKAELLDAAAAKKDNSLEMLRMKKAELQTQFDELSNSITNHVVFGQGRLLKAFPRMKHRDYYEVIQELKKKLER
ncbi:putative ABC transporter permease [Blautia sp. HCP28S3_G10]|uniref:putative ABC transporter permease n=1 Tax=Blautia sp. HCP28S3_G10 TaxID=3438908 RepID=UPI003F8C9547